MKFKMLPYLILLITVFPNSLCSPDALKPLTELNEIHQHWLQLTSVPEIAHMMQYPPLSYWTHRSPVSVNVSQIANPHSMDKFQHFHAPLNQTDKRTKCSSDLLQILSHIESDWAMTMIDSYGKLESGVTVGNIIWPGSFRQCKSVYAPVDEEKHGDFHGRYCMASWNIINVLQAMPEIPISTGICIPDSCDASYIQNTAANIGHILGHLPLLDKLKPHLELLSVECKYASPSPDGITVVFITVLCFFLLLVFIGSAITVSAKLSQSSCLKAPSDQTAVKQAVDPEVCRDAKQIFERSHSLDHEQTLVNESVLLPEAVECGSDKRSLVKDVLQCFCAFTNGAKILNTDVPSGQLRSLHGIRFLSLTWVIMGHTYIAAVAIIENKREVLKDLDSFAFQMVMQAPFAVDSFFLLSGFLVTYLFLREMAKRNGKMNWVYFYFHRLWRLTPVYIIVVLFYMLVFKYFGSGPFWDENFGDTCRHTFWKYILYINNFIPVKDMCVGWSWYLANDMQFYVISPLFLYPLWRWPKVGVALILSTLCASWVTTAVLSYKYELIPMFVGVTKVQNFTEYQDRMWYSFDMIYDKPYTRIGPYFIGMLLGYLMFKVGNQRQFLQWYYQLLGWILASFCSVSVVFGLYHTESNLLTGMFYNALCRSSFTLGLAWVIFICEIGHGGILHKFLSFKFWIPLSRLTFCAYLVHLMFIHGFYQGYKVMLYFTQTVMVTNFFGFLTLSYILAFIVSIVFESPMLNLEKLALKRVH